MGRNMNVRQKRVFRIKVIGGIKKKQSGGIINLLRTVVVVHITQRWQHTAEEPKSIKSN
jgi:hypothetical protein